MIWVVSFMLKTVHEELFQYEDNIALFIGSCGLWQTSRNIYVYMYIVNKSTLFSFVHHSIKETEDSSSDVMDGLFN